MKYLSCIILCLFTFNFAVAADAVDYKALAKEDIERMIKKDSNETPYSEPVDPKVAKRLEKLAINHAATLEELKETKLEELNLNNTSDTLITICCDMSGGMFCRDFYGNSHWNQYADALSWYTSVEDVGGCCSANFVD